MSAAADCLLRVLAANQGCVVLLYNMRNTAATVHDAMPACKDPPGAWLEQTCSSTVWLPASSNACVILLSCREVSSSSKFNSWQLHEKEEELNDFERGRDIMRHYDAIMMHILIADMGKQRALRRGRATPGAA